MAIKKPLTNESIRRRAVKILETCGAGGDSKDRNDYSGRGMFGRVSSVAITSSVHPQSPAGEKLRDLGLTFDSMGRDWIYYTRT